MGDNSNKNMWLKHWDSASVKSDKWRAFRNRYVKMSDYTTEYETGFWKRLFLLEDWMHEENVTKAFMVESDVISFVNYSYHVYPYLPADCIAALMIPQRQDIEVWAASTHFSFWTISALEDFTSFCIDAYANDHIKHTLASKHQWHTTNRVPGGISEMTLLYLWSKNNAKVFNLCGIINDTTFDLAMCDSRNYFENEYRMRLGFKRFTFRNGIPYGYNKILEKEIRFGCIHCQGWAKSIMRFLYSPNMQKFYWLFIPIVSTMNKVTRPLLKLRSTTT